MAFQFLVEIDYETSLDDDLPEDQWEIICRGYEKFVIECGYTKEFKVS